VSAIVGNIQTTGQDVCEKLGELSPLMAASFLAQVSNAAITTMNAGDTITNTITGIQYRRR
jgi:hypothetical protein